MISIIIPCFNQGEYLPDAMDSIFAQEFHTGDHEIIIINDGSTDNSLEIANKYRSDFLVKKNKGETSSLKDIKVINQVNKGLSSARNTGIMNAQGDWILPLDADDILKPLCLYRIREIVEGFFPPDVIGLSFKEFGLRNTEIVLMPKPIIEDFKVGNRIGYCSAIKKSALLEVGGYSPRMFAGYEDYALWFDLLTRGKVINTIPEILWLYRTKEKSMINDAMEHHNELVAQINKDFNVGLPEIKTPLPK